MTISASPKNSISVLGLVAGGRVRLAVYDFKSLTGNSKRTIEIPPPAIVLRIVIIYLP